MSLAVVTSAAVVGVDAIPVAVEIDLTFGLPGFQVVGLPDGAIKESRDRVRSALRNSGFDLYQHKITVNLAPADVRKEGSAYDLPIALAMLCAQGVLEPDLLSDTICIGELGLDGAIRAVAGALSVAILARDAKAKRVIVPMANWAEAAVVSGVEVVAVDNLLQLVNCLRGDDALAPQQRTAQTTLGLPDGYGPDLAEVRGQEHVKRALEVAAAGGHNMLLIGPPGSGKTMLARRLASILPDPTFEESLETTKVYSVAGLLPEGTSLMRQRPFRSPHHSISDAGLVGGGTYPRPGEVSLSHNGVLFLDELPEFKKHVLEVMRQPLEDGHVTISRAAQRITYPANFMLVASMNPCPCGYYGDPAHTCMCTPGIIQRYQGRLSGPLLDRIDIHVEVPAIRYRELSEDRRGEASEGIRARVEAARGKQAARYARRRGIYANAQMTPKDIERHCKLDATGHTLMERVVDKLGMSARATTRILKVARTIADLEGAEKLDTAHLSEAIQYRTLDRQTS